MRKAVPIILLVVFLVSACSTINIKDPVKTGLYAIKEEWVAIREYMIRENLLGRVSNEKLDEFKAKDLEFTRMYNLAESIRKVDPYSADMDKAIQDLKWLLIEARQKYYPGGG